MLILRARARTHKPQPSHHLCENTSLFSTAVSFYYTKISYPVYKSNSTAWHEAAYSSFTTARGHKLQQLQIPLHNLAVCIADIWWEIIHKFVREGGCKPRWKQPFLPTSTGMHLKPCWCHVHLMVLTVRKTSLPRTQATSRAPGFCLLQEIHLRKDQGLKKFYAFCVLSSTCSENFFTPPNHPSPSEQQRCPPR